MKGIILAGGTGSRLWPITANVCKQLAPVFDKPMIYYPLSTLMLAGITDIAIITRSTDTLHFRNLLSDGSHLGLKIEYFVQNTPGGIAEAFLICENFLDGDDVCLILGDNIFHGPGLGLSLKSVSSGMGATVFAQLVSHPERYGVVEFDHSGIAISIEEKPIHPKSDYIIPGLYFYDNGVIEIAKNLKPSARGELEITEVNAHYLKEGSLRVLKLPRGTVWMDTGNPKDLHSASSYVRMIEEMQGVKVSAPEEVAYRIGLINARELLDICKQMPEGEYKVYLEKVASE
jgi:glucose-1-phosphate thymidylyltransferase